MIHDNVFRTIFLQPTFFASLIGFGLVFHDVEAEAAAKAASKAAEKAIENQGA